MNTGLNANGDGSVRACDKQVGEQLPWERIALECERASMNRSLARKECGKWVEPRDRTAPDNEGVDE
jgi:hypothetical protein